MHRNNACFTHENTLNFHSSLGLKSSNLRNSENLLVTNSCLLVSKWKNIHEVF